jgi:branched-chain amino acid transport system ATP-binding protein
MDVTGIPLAMGSRLAKDLTYRDQKVVDLARALALHPRVLLLDEPDSGLDEGESGGLVSLLRSVHRAASVTIVLISHHVGLVLDVANTVTVLDAGRVIAHGSPESVVKEENVIEAFIGSRNVTRGTQSEHE